MAYRDAGLKTVTQIAIVTRDIESASRKWAKILGAEVPQIHETPPGLSRKMTYRGKGSNDQAKLAFISVGQVTIELIEPIGTQSSWYEVLEKKGEGIHHIAFNVQDVDKTIEQFESEGMPLLHFGRWGGDNGTFAYVDSRDELGVLIELLHADKPSK